MRKINIMHLRSATGNGGGPEKTILNSPRYIDSGQFEMSVVYLKKSSDPDFRVPEQAARLGLRRFYVVEEGSWFDRRAMARVRQLMDEQQIDVLHTHGYKSDWWGWLIRRRRPALKLVTTVHGWTVMQNLRQRFYYQAGKLPLYFFDEIIAVNPEIVDALQKIGVPAAKMRVILNAIDTREFSRRAPLKKETEQLTIGYIGRLSPEKRVEDLLRACRELISAGKVKRVLIAGEGPLKEELIRLSEALGARPYTDFLGHVDPREFFEKVDIFVNPSLKEGLPNTVLESMAMESAVVATDVGAVGQLVRHLETGMIIPPRSPSALRQTLRELIGKPQLRLALIRNARHYVATHHDFAKRMKKMEAIYKNLFSSR